MKAKMKNGTPYGLTHGGHCKSTRNELVTACDMCNYEKSCCIKVHKERLCVLALIEFHKTE